MTTTRTRRLATPAILLAVALVALLVIGSWAGGKDKKSDPSPAGPGLSTISFTTEKDEQRWPSWDLGSVGIRNAKALRPLYLAGKGYGGALSVHFNRDAEALGDFTGEKKIGKLMSAARTTGCIKAICDEYSVSDAGTDQFAARELITAETRPLVVIEVRNIRQWVPMTRKKTTGGSRTKYEAVADGTVRLVHRTWSGEGLNRKCTDKVLETTTFSDAGVEVLFRDLTVTVGRRTRPVGAAMVRGTGTITGSELGLTGRDAGELEIYFSVMGWTDYGQSSTDAMTLDKATEK
jgi:hypothetical protein